LPHRLDRYIGQFDDKDIVEVASETMFRSTRQRSSYFVVFVVVVVVADFFIRHHSAAASDAEVAKGLTITKLGVEHLDNDENELIEAAKGKSCLFNAFKQLFCVYRHEDITMLL